MGYSKSVISKIIVNDAISASYALTSSFSKSALSSSHSVTSSYALSALSSSYAISASWAPGSTPSTPGGLNTQIQFNSSSIFSGSNNLTFDYNNSILALTGSFILSQSLTNFTSINSTTSGDNLLSITNTGSYTSAFGKYTLYSGSNARAGEFVTVWNGGTIRYYDNATSDIGDTSIIAFYSVISSGQVSIFVYGQSGWTVKMLTTFI